MRILVLGGAGFIGSHLVDALISKNHDVTIFDSLDPQVHGDAQRPPTYLNPKANLVIGDVRDREALKAVMPGHDAAYFLAAAVGVGQSMYEVERYVAVNSLGSAIFLDLIVNSSHSFQKLIVASSMSIYGEGAYKNETGELVFPTLRKAAQLGSGVWEHLDKNNRPLTPIGTPESKPLYPTSVYAVTKRDHEELFLSVGEGYGIPTTALRFFNVYGDRQSLSNPYTGVAAIFSSLILNGNAPQIFEDGNQTRDFIHVSDIVQGLLLALEKDEANGEVFNVGTGTATSIKEIAASLSSSLNFSKPALITNKFRVGDIRHCYADISKIKNLLGYSPRVSLDAGMQALCAWVSKQEAENRVAHSTEELKNRNLLR